MSRPSPAQTRRLIKNIALRSPGGARDTREVLGILEGAGIDRPRALAALRWYRDYAPHPRHRENLTILIPHRRSVASFERPGAEGS